VSPEHRDFLQPVSRNFAEAAQPCCAQDQHCVDFQADSNKCPPPYRVHCIAKAYLLRKNHGGEVIQSRRGASVFDVQLVRTLCQEITEEQDPPRVEELLHLLQAVIKDDQEEVRLRMSFLTRKYAAAVSDSKAAD
jgi:hypothetical protein